MKRHFLLIAMLCIVSVIWGQQLQRVAPATVGMDAGRLANADKIINHAIQQHEIPGAVLAVVRHGKMAYLKAFGNRALEPKVEAMTTGTVFDMASCSKAMSTAVCALILIESGQLRLMDRVDTYIPNFDNWKDNQGETEAIRIVDLMTHSSGLPPYADVEMLKAKYGAPSPDGLIDYISHCRRDFKPTTDFQYSCLNYITLQRIIETISGKSLRDFAKQHIFDVLGMKHTDYNPSPELTKQCAPTEKLPDGTVLRGVVHDPLARVMNGGISGNAGLFSTADDIALFCAAVQNGGIWNGHRILSKLGVQCMRTVPRRVANLGRTPGWDIFTAYATNNGDLLSNATYGHTGFTGTSIVVDPINDVSVIFLTNAVHPSGKSPSAIISLRSYIANAVAASIIQ